MSTKLPPQIDATPEECYKANERLKLRRALRAEFLRKCTDPHTTDARVFDPCMQRYYSMHMTYFDRFIPTLKNFGVWFAMVVFPITAYGLLLKHDRDKLDARCRSGEIKYEDRLFRYN